jgi:TM2 domain-containing membrane protein YozV
MSEYQDQQKGPVQTAAGMWDPSQRQAFDARRKSPFLAAVLSIIPGLGQVYIGYYIRGFVTVAVFLMTFTTGIETRSDLAPVLILSAVFIWVFNVIDAGRMAALYNHAAAGSNTIELPSDLKLPKLGGSIMGGVLILIAGGIALSNTAFGMSLDWLEQWWPVFPLALGAYLFVRGVMDARATREKRSEPVD